MTALLEARSIAKAYPGGGFLAARPDVRAVDSLSLRLDSSETLGLVGESGCGKSTTGRLLLGLERPSEGEICFNGAPLPAVDSQAWRRLRPRMQLIYQDPLGALDRRLPIARQVREPLDIHDIGDAAERTARVRDLLDAVGLSARQASLYPHQLSGGQRQRAVLARALVTNPDLLVCDEPVSALDVSIQAQVINLLVDLQRQLGLAMIFISHDLKVVRQVSRRVAIMYLGRIVEEGDADNIFAEPKHPYTKALVSAAPQPGMRGRQRMVLKGEPPNPAARPSGCSFHPRCPVAIDRCSIETPELIVVGSRAVACHLAVAS